MSDRFEITTYKGQTIYYSEYSDKFECDIEFNNNVKQTKRNSLADVKKEIDVFKKLNIEFKPFKFIVKDYNGELSFSTCTAIRSDRKLVIPYFSSSSYVSFDEFEKKYSVYDSDIEKEYAALKQEDEEFRVQYKAKLAKLYERLKPINIDELKDL